MEVFYKDEVKGEAFKYAFDDYLYINLADEKEREKIKKLEKKYIRENESFYKSWNDYDKWQQFKYENYGTRLYKETEDRIIYYEIFTEAFYNLYTIGTTIRHISSTNNEFTEYLVKSLCENGIKLKVSYKKQPTRDMRVIEIDPAYREVLKEIYFDIADGESLVNKELANFKGWDLENIKEGLLISIKDAINNGYCRNHDGLISTALKYYRAPKEKDRPSLINIFKKYKIKFKLKILEGVRDNLKRLFQNYKIRVLQIIKKCKKVASFSGGKDSAYMIIKAMQKGIKFDHIVYADTGLEYPEMYEYIDRFERYIKQDIIRLKSKITFDDWFFKPFSRGKNEGKIHGFPYVVGDGCWAKRELKLKSIAEFKKSMKESFVDYIGIAADEPIRYRKLILEKQQAPLVDWGITEQQCRDELDDMGLLNPLYCKFKRLGCWLCPKQGLNSLAVLYKDYPSLWQKLKQYQEHDYKPFKPDLSVVDLEKKIILMNQ